MDDTDHQEQMEDNNSMSDSDQDDFNHPYSGHFVPAEYVRDDEDDQEADSSSGVPASSDWVHHSLCNIDLRLDDVDQWLYEISKKEIAVINNRIKRRLRANGKFTECDIVSLWLKDTARNLLELVNTQRSNSVELFSLDEVVLFIKSTMWMMAHNITYTVYYDENNRSMYPTASEGISKRRYHELLRALSSSSSDMPLEPSDSQKTFMEDVARICRTIAFVKNKSILSFDDNHLRLRSNGVEESGFVRIRNPKAFGPVFHAMVSMGTGLFEAGHIARRNESNTDCAKHCLISLDHQRLEKHLEL